MNYSPASQSDSTDHRPALVAAYRCASDVADRVRLDQLGGRTPCPEYDVAALVDHLVGAGWRAVALGRGEPPTGEEFPHVELAEASGQLRQASAEAAAAWTDDRLDQTTTMPWGETYRGSTLVDMYLSEIVAHAWDLAAATGQLPSCDEDLAAAALAAAKAMLRPEYRDMMGTGNPFGAEQPVGDGATTLDRFVAFMGRRVDWSSTTAK
ncbi:MAG: TIGR03086 family metal-binding protein [Actinomycetota bacterium]|nr:TIGR03086 family metal-binding protein [Actinomycetota bacterium]